MSPNEEGSSSGVLGLRKLLTETGWTFWLNISVRGVHFLTAIVLARLLGVEGFGAYGYAMGWVSLLSVFGGLGLGELLVREVATYVTTERWARLKGLLRWSRRTGLWTSLGITAAAAVIVWMLRRDSDSMMLRTLWVSLPLIPILVMVRLDQAAVRGLMRLVPGQLAEAAVLPILFLLLVGLIALDVVPADPTWAIGLHVAAGVVALLFALRVARKFRPDKVQEIKPEIQASVWWQSSLALFLITAVRVVNGRADILLLGGFRGAEAVGLYNAAARGAEVLTLPVVVAGVVLAPRFASLHADGARKDLWRLYWMATAAMAVIAGLGALGLIVFGDIALGLFGTGFSEASLALTILALGQWLHAATGPVNQLLVMTGRERATGIFVIGGTTLNVALNLLLIPRWGSEGAAFATATSMSVLNLALLGYALKDLDGPFPDPGS